MALKARVLQVMAPIQRALTVYDGFIKRFVYPVLNEFRWASWIVPGVMFGVVAILIGHIAGEKAGGVAVAMVVILSLADAFEHVFHAGSWIRNSMLVWFMASIFLVLLDTPDTAVQMLTDLRVYMIMGGFLGGFILVILMYAFGLGDGGIDEWRNTRLRNRIADEVGMSAVDVDRVLAALDREMFDDAMVQDWCPVSTVDAANREFYRRRNSRRAARAARKAAK